MTNSANKGIGQSMEFIDTHCHIQDIKPVEKTGDDLVAKKWVAANIHNPQDVIEAATAAGVVRMVVVGCDLRDSKLAAELAAKQESCVASIGVHPHEAKTHNTKEVEREFVKLHKSYEITAIGECGLDYFYEHSPKGQQIQLLELQLDLANKLKLPVIFHVREAFDDFWPIFDNFRGIQGVLHSFTDNVANVEKALDRGLYIGLNGIMTFTKIHQQLEMAKKVPLANLLLETDAPFLTPVPQRGTICQPKHVVETAKFLADLRGESLDSLARATTQNAKTLFQLI